MNAVHFPSNSYFEYTSSTLMLTGILNKHPALHNRYLSL